MPGHAVIKPKLRKLDRFPLERDGESLLVLLDPHRLDEPLAVDPLLGPYLDMMDGQRSIAQMRQSLILRGKAALPLEELQAVVDTLAECGFLDDDRFKARWRQALLEFQSTALLPACLAGVAYPQDPQLLREHFKTLSTETATPARLAHIWPYCPYPFTGDNPDLGAFLSALPPAQDLDGIVLLVTSHHDGAMPYQILDKDLDTVLGQLPGAQRIASALIRPRPWLIQEPLRWKGEQSLEVPLLALRATYQDACPPILPLLCGRACFSPSQDEAQVLQSASMLAEIENLLGTGRWLLLACAQLGQSEKMEIQELDQTLLTALKQKDQRAFFPKVIAKIPSQERPAGAPVFATFLSILPPTWRCTQSALTRQRNLDGQGSAGHAYLHYGPAQ